MIERHYKSHEFDWALVELREQITYDERTMFGSLAIYLHGRLVLVLGSRNSKEWCGALIPTEKSHHDSLIESFPALVVHSKLRKWLYLCEDHDAFEESVDQIVQSILQQDPRIGVFSKSV